MKRKRKIFALVCLSTILYQTFSPLAALALTSGPASPDASSFEPVDTSNMVNPVTGDFVYNVPLIEVPGPEGSFPLSLSYHAGINPEQESSWVGLGWTLNPGSIARSVNGFPDDWANRESSRRDYWAGGVTTVTSIGITVPIMNYGTANLGLVKVSDTYLGVGYGWNVGASFGVGGAYSPFSVSVGIGSSPFSGGLTLTAGLGIGFDQLGNSSLSFKGSVGENNSLGISVDAPYGVLGASLQTNGGFSFSSPVSSGNLGNSKESWVNTVTSVKSLNLVFVQYEKRRTRYWSDETQTSNIYGSLKPEFFNLSNMGDYPDNIVSDGYVLPQSFSEGNNPDKEQGGAFPAFDNYTVTGQGIGGIIRPYMYQGSVIKQNVIERDGSSQRRTVRYNGRPTFPNSFGFRFVGDFSNSLLLDYPAFSTEPAVIRSLIPFGSIPRQTVNGVENYQNIDNTLIGSKSITYFKLQGDGSIKPAGGQTNFIAPTGLGLDRTKYSAPLAEGAEDSGIAGFAITNENGVTYHYNLPAYNYGEDEYQENINQSSGLRFNRQTKSAGYAYTWHLTAITGPDYVDRGVQGVFDDADYGYWVSFDYGKWNSEFVWRTPTEGYTENFDDQFRSVSLGKKEVYYLNAIRTRTHTALFEKEARTDGKSASIESFNKNWSSQNNVSTDYSNQGLYNNNSTQSLRLSHIYILKNGTFNALGPSTGNGAGLVSTGRTIACNDCELPNNVLDISDVNSFSRSQLEYESLRVIDFNYDYSLAKGSTTSFNFSAPSNKQGKLTLKSIKIRGKRGVSYLPSTEFGYELSSQDQMKGTGTVNGINITGSTVRYAEGDLIETDEAVPIYCGFVDRVTPSGSGFNIIVRGGTGANLGLKGIRKTKNPPYQKDRYDYWGMFKSDHFVLANKNLNRAPTRNSIRSVDVWSLRKIKTMTGAVVDVGYEGHDYSKSLYSSNRSIWFGNLSLVSTGVYRLAPGNLLNNCERFFKPGDKFDVYFVKRLSGKLGNENIVENRLEMISGVEIHTVNPDNLLIKLTADQIQTLFHIEFSPPYTDVSITQANFSPTLSNSNTLGGSGVRVGSIVLTGMDGVKYRTNYSYQEASKNTSSGSTIYEPLISQRYISDGSVTKAESDMFTRILNPKVEESVRFGAELPGPGIMYSRVETGSQIEYPDGVKSLSTQKTVSDFFSYPDLQIELNEVTASQSSSEYSIRNLLLKKFVSLFGAPKSISYYDGNGKLVRRTVKQYLHDGIINDFFTTYKTRLNGFAYQGLISERFSEVKNVYSNAYSKMVQFGTMIGREDYPLVNVGTVEYDYIHNTKTSTKINAFDFYSGAVTESVSTDSYGNSFLSKSTPAYVDYSAMGPNQRDSRMKNMLTQLSSRNIYRLNANGVKEYIVSASYNVWSNGGAVLGENGERTVQNGSVVANGNVWRQTSDYIWMPATAAANGMTVVASFVAFPGSNPAGANVAWKRNNENVLMDAYSHVLSTQDFKGNQVTTRYGYKNAKPVLNGTFAKYGEIAFSGAEDENINNVKKLEVKIGGGILAPVTFSHTGQRSLALDIGKTGFEYSVPVSELTVGRTYMVSTWVRKSAAHNVKLYYELDGVRQAVSLASTASTKVSGDWVLINLEITVSGGSTVKVFAQNDGTAPVFVDDFRFQPKNGTSSALVYDPKTGELTHTLDQNNLFTRYEYNAMGQVIATYRERFGGAPYKVSEIQLNYSTKSFNGLSN